MSQSPLAAKSLSPGQGMVSGRPTVAGPQRKGFVPTGTCEPPRAKLLALAQGPREKWEGQGCPWWVALSIPTLLHRRKCQVHLFHQTIYPLGSGHRYPQTPRVLSAPGCSLASSAPFGSGVDQAWISCQSPVSHLHYGALPTS